jgi:hypothetical protein
MDPGVAHGVIDETLGRKWVEKSIFWTNCSIMAASRSFAELRGRCHHRCRFHRDSL